MAPQSPQAPRPGAGCAAWRANRSPPAAALWCCALLLLQWCSSPGADAMRLPWQGSPSHRLRRAAAAASALAAAAADAGAGAGVAALPLPGLEAAWAPDARPRSRRAPGRSLASRHSADARSPALLPYPQEAGAVARFLAEAGRAGPCAVPVWFVIVVDPASAGATNVSEARAQAQVDLLNRAYGTGLAGPDGAAVVLESGTLTAPEQHTRGGGGVPAAATAKAPHAVSAHVRPPANMRLAQATAAAAASAARPLWRFELRGVRYATSAAPMCVGSRVETLVKSAWRDRLVAEGGTRADRTLVIYVSDITSPACRGAVAGYDVMFGFASSPFDVVFWKQHSMAYRDGVVVDPRYLLDPGAQRDAGSGALHGATSGAQLVHEVGHWMGLEHTFDGGCSADEAAGDQVHDTPAEAHPTKWGGVDLKDASAGCAYRDSCGGLPGADFTANFMTYQNLACARSFTPGQQARMLYLFRAVRKD